MPKASCSPLTVPTRVSRGRSGSVGFDTGGGRTGGAALTGMFQSGLPRGGSSAVVTLTVLALIGSPRLWPKLGPRLGPRLVPVAIPMMTSPTGSVSLPDIISHLATGRRLQAARAADLLWRPMREWGPEPQAARQRGMASRPPDRTAAAGGPADRARSWRSHR